MFAKKLSIKDNQHLLENLNKFKEEKALNFKIKDEIVSFLTVNHLAKTNIQDIKCNRIIESLVTSRNTEFPIIKNNTTIPLKKASQSGK